MNLKQYSKLKQKNESTYKLFNPKHKVVKHLKECSSDLFVEVYRDNAKNLHSSIQTFTCKNKFCSICEKKKAIKVATNMEKKLEELGKKMYQRFTFLTLTVPNCKLKDLKKTLRKMSKGSKRLIDNLQKNHGITGTIKKLEITYSKNSDGEIMCHPHYHIIQSLHINSFRYGKLLSQEKYADLWGKAMKFDFTPIVDIRTFDFENMKKSIQEITKYITKDTDLEIFNENEISNLDIELKGVRFYASSGLLKISFKDLDIDKSEQVDITTFQKVGEAFYSYNPKLNQYILRRLELEPIWLGYEDEDVAKIELLKHIEGD